MKTMPKVKKDLKSNFQNDQIENSKLNYLTGGDGGTGDDDGDKPGLGEW